VAILVAAALPAAAQNEDKPLVGVGLSFLHDEGGTATGFAVDIAKAFRSMNKAQLSAVGDLGWNRFGDADSNVLSILGGVRITGTADAKLQPYGQFLLGLEHCCEDNGFAIQPGAGIDYLYNDKVAIRAAVDFRRTSYGDGFDPFNAARFWFGISTRLGN
jgi:hypothetical protein